MMKKLLKMSRSELMSVLRAVVIALCAYFVLFALVSAAVTPQRYDIQVGAPAPVQLLATKDVEDTVTTQALREAAANDVAPSYKSADPQVTMQVMADIEEQLSLLYAMNQTSGESVQAEFALSEDQRRALLSAAADALDRLFARAESLTRDALLSTIPEGQEDATLARIERDLNADGYEQTLVSIAMGVVGQYLQPNMLIDEETTEANRQKARNAVQPEMVVKNEVIVREGEIVTTAQFAMLTELGLTTDKAYDMKLILGVALLMLLLLASVGLYMYRYEHDIWRRPRTLLLLSLIFILVVGISLVARELNAYIMPVSLGALLVTVLVRAHLALFLNFILSVLVSLLASASGGLFTMTTFSIMIMSVISGPIVVTVMRNRQQRTATLLAGVLVAVCNFLTTLSVGLVNSASIDTVLTYAAWSAGGAMLSAVLCIGIQPLLEWIFNLTTSAKLLELSNPNQPLLRRLLLEAPGSYHHSIIVANLAETAATAVGANGLLARVGAYYHDVGKLKRPLYFKENQMGDNPHDRTDPRVSAAILTAHTRDGYLMGQKARLPEPVLEIIRQHHGDSPMLFFYDKARKLYGDNVDVSAFRYEGPRPRSKEAAVVMLADTIEAAARALPNPDSEKLDALIRKLVYAKMTDGQLNECDLTFSDLDRICRAFATVLSGVFHERIEYPDVAVPPRETEPVPEMEEPAPEAEVREGDENAD